MHTHVWEAVRRGLAGIAVFACLVCGAVQERETSCDVAPHREGKTVIAAADTDPFDQLRDMAQAFSDLGALTDPASHVRQVHLKMTQPWAERAYTTIASSGQVL